ncbi:MAG: cyclopropane fatty acyl phospholipid synthase [bacterium]|nr:cyclopropane fatty acyl phospholipid synthase [bacterium]
MISFEEKVKKITLDHGVIINGDKPWDMQVKNDKFYQRLILNGSLGLGESYMDGWWEAKRLDEFFFKIMSTGAGRNLSSASQYINKLKALITNRQSKSRSKQVAEQHYDLSNEFYKDMLDSRLQYTCAYWKNAKNLEEAQKNKLDLSCKKLKLKKGDRVLELGCGWGGFAKFAVENYGCEVIAYNISAEQVKYARENCQGLPATFIHADYREAVGEFDKVAAIGVAEHVGYKNYRGLMEVAHRSLKPHGLFLLHSIATNISTTICDPWFDKYIFPGGMLPSISQLGEAMEGLFVMEDWHNFGPDYDKTLMAWYENFDKNWSKHKDQFGEKFYKMWEYYLKSLAGGFRARHIQLWQVVMSKDGISGGYESVR